MKKISIFLKGLQFYLTIIYAFLLLVIDFNNDSYEITFVCVWFAMALLTTFIWQRSSIDERKAYIGNEWYKKYLHTDLFYDED